MKKKTEELVRPSQTCIGRILGLDERNEKRDDLRPPCVLSCIVETEHRHVHMLFLSTLTYIRSARYTHQKQLGTDERYYLTSCNVVLCTFRTQLEGS